MGGSSRLIFVIIPARNAADHLPDQLAALGAQTYRGDWEVIVADNGSTDSTRVRAEAARGLGPRLQVVDVGDVAGASRARNAGAHAAAGDLLLFCDADDRVDSGWVEAMSRALTTCEAAGGRLRRVAPPGGFDPGHQAFTNGLGRKPGFLSYPSTACMRPFFTP